VVIPAQFFLAYALLSAALLGLLSGLLQSKNVRKV